MSLIFMMIVLENQLKMSWNVLEFEKKFLVGTMKKAKYVTLS